MKTTVVNIRRDTDWDVYIGRPGKGGTGCFGNPISFHEECPVCKEIHVDDEEGRLGLLACYKSWFWKEINSNPVFRIKVMELKGKKLGCFCKPRPCHGDIIVEWIKAGCPIRAVQA